MQFSLFRHASGDNKLATLVLSVLCTAAPAYALDFNGDGLEDLLFRDRQRGDHRLALVVRAPEEPHVAARGTLLLSGDLTRSRGFDIRTGDFDGDRRSDILSRDLITGRTQLRLMDGTTVRASATLTDLPRAGDTELQAIADFDGDGCDDLLFRDRDSAMWRLLKMQGLTVDVASSGDLPFARDPAMQLVAASDFNGDGRADLLMRHRESLDWHLYLMHGRQMLATGKLGFLPGDARWQLEATSDLNGDKRTDLLFRHRETDAWYAWFLDGLDPLPESGSARITEDPAWSLQTLADFDGDGFKDALLIKPESGALRVNFLMERWRLEGSSIVDLTAYLGRRVAGTGDFDGDGADDVLLSDRGTKWLIVNLNDPLNPRTETLDVDPPREYALACEPPDYRQFGMPPKPADTDSRSAFLTWSVPRTRENGEALCPHELLGYQLRYETADAGSFKKMNILDPRSDSAVLERLSPGTWYFRIFTLDSEGYLSAASPSMIKTVH